jgi:hypothetical protein
MRNGGQPGRTDPRGNSRNRRARKLRMLSDPNFGGTGTTVPCVHGCGTILDYDSVQADRKIPGGTYAYRNVQPSCQDCNIQRGDGTSCAARFLVGRTA